MHRSKVRRQTITKSKTFEEVCNIVAEFLPDGFELNIRLENGSGVVELCDFGGDWIDYGGYDYAYGLNEEIEAALSHAEALANGNCSAD